MGFNNDSLPNINSKGIEANSFDAIVIGSGMTGRWAAKELCEKRLKTLVLERGRNVEHVKDYPTATLDPWQLQHRDVLTEKMKEENPVVSQCYAFTEQQEWVKIRRHQ